MTTFLFFMAIIIMTIIGYHHFGPDMGDNLTQGGDFYQFDLINLFTLCKHLRRESIKTNKQTNMMSYHDHIGDMDKTHHG